MSSKIQFKDALERDKQTILQLTKLITEKNDIIFNLNVRIGELIDKYNKKWWQFWK
jgi:hypothetical protein